MLTEQREKMHAHVDQVGLAVFYLQRHRVELVIRPPDPVTLATGNVGSYRTRPTRVSRKPSLER
jgi:hypothetical protein